MRRAGGAPLRPFCKRPAGEQMPLSGESLAVCEMASCSILHIHSLVLAIKLVGWRSITMFSNILRNQARQIAAYATFGRTEP